MLILKHAPLGADQKQEDYDVLSDGAVVGRIFSHGQPRRKDGSGCGRWRMGTTRIAPTHGYEPTREEAMAAFAKRWRRE